MVRLDRIKVPNLDNFSLTIFIVSSLTSTEKERTMTEMKNNIRQHPNGTWEGRYYDVDGKQHSLYGRTKAIVKDKLASKRAEIVSGNSITETDLTIEQWGWAWMQTFKAGKTKHSTMDNYESDFRLHVVPYIGM